MYDSFLLEYLQSGEAWLLVGSGPSIEMGYPSWADLASGVVEACALENIDEDKSRIEQLRDSGDYPGVFEEAKNILGDERLRQILRGQMYPNRAGKIYGLIAKWPINVYLTTNYDNEINNELVKLGESFQLLTNSEDHMSLLNPELSGAIVKLHGDLTAEKGLILTSTHYNNISSGEEWKYWRTKMTSVCQMEKLIVIGHSLTDENIRHILEVAKLGSGVERPVCWIAPNVPQNECKEYLEKYRVRVITYEGDERHTNLVRLIESLSDFVPSRTSVPIIQQIKSVYQSPLEVNAGAPGFFVFNKFCEHIALEDVQSEILVSAIQSILPNLESLGEFKLEKALKLVGWPNNLMLDEKLTNNISKLLVEKGMLEEVQDGYKVAKDATKMISENKEKFDGLRERFKNSLVIRINRKFPSLNSEAESIAEDIEASLVGYFRENGLTLASVIFSAERGEVNKIPSSITKYINLISARYDSLIKRQAFLTTVIDIFKQAGTAEREYLGRMSQGFFAFHVLGVFGDVALERLTQLTESVWIIDSNIQIRALALGDIGNYLVRDCLKRMKELGVRLFCTEKLFEETAEHMRFAAGVIGEYHPESPYVMAAARGDSPFRKSNEFLRGFIRWQKAGNRADWDKYIYSMISSHRIDAGVLEKAINEIGIEIVPLADWPGFSEDDHYEIDTRTEEIKEKWEELQPQGSSSEEDSTTDAYRKALPEGEASIIVKKERSGDYHIMSGPGESSDAWFISSTSILNLVERGGNRITWQPESFFQFISTICKADESSEAEKAFETVLMSVAETGINLLDEETLSEVFGGVIDQAELNIKEQRDLYKTIIEEKYGESPEEILNRMSPENRPIALIQLVNEVAQREMARRESAEEASVAASKKAISAEKELERVQKFRLKYIRKQSRKKKHKTVNKKRKKRK